MVSTIRKTEITADGYLVALAEKGIKYLFATGGTDFAPLVESYARAEKIGETVPIPIVVPHENIAVAIAHGYYLVTGSPQAVMVHVNVGTANAICGIINAASDNIPILFTAGRTPLTEYGNIASRDGIAQWAQEMYDQAGMVRENVKWDFELRSGDQIPQTVERALYLAMSEPRGPVYLTLPREVLCAPMESITIAGGSGLPTGTTFGPDTRLVNKVCDILRKAQQPLIITRTHGAKPEDAESIVNFADKFAIPAVEYRPQTNSFASDHPMLLGYDPGPYLQKADVILVIENDIPWLPQYHGHPNEICKIIHIGSDPAFRRIPTRGYQSDISIASNASLVLEQITKTLEQYSESMSSAIAVRREELSANKKRYLKEKPKQKSGLETNWGTSCVSQAIPDDALIFNEYPLVLSQLNLRTPRTYFGMPAAGGLGWAMGAALGAKLAAPDRFVVAAVGDGTYMLSNPIAAHFMSNTLNLPILFLIFNNTSWKAVPRSTLRLFPDGYFAQGSGSYLSDLTPSPFFEKIMNAYDAMGTVVKDPSTLPAALESSINFIQSERKQALINILIE